MELTDFLKLPMPGPDDTGATAAYLQRLAREADARMGQYEDELNAATRPYVSVCRALNGDTISGRFEYTVQSEIFANTGSSVVYSNFPTYDDPRWVMEGFSNFPVPGWWSIGAAKITSPQPTGITNNSVFAYILEVRSTDLNPGRETTIYRTTRTYADSQTGSESGEIYGTFYLPPGARNNYVRLFMYHDARNGSNVALDRSIDPGTVGWRLFLGSGDVAQRAGF